MTTTPEPFVLDTDTHNFATAADIGRLFAHAAGHRMSHAQAAEFARDTVDRDGNLVLTNAQARRLLALAVKAGNAGQET